MKKGTALIILGILMFLTGIVLIPLSTFSKAELVMYKQTMVEYKASIPPSIGVPITLPRRFGVNLTGSFLNYTQDQPVIEIRDPTGKVIYSNSSFPPPSIIEFDGTIPGIYTVDFNIVFGEGSVVEVYYHDYRKEIVHPYAILFYPGGFLAVLGIAASATGLFMPSKGSEEGQ